MDDWILKLPAKMKPTNETARVATTDCTGETLALSTPAQYTGFNDSASIVPNATILDVGAIAASRSLQQFQMASTNPTLELGVSDATPCMTHTLSHAQGGPSSERKASSRQLSLSASLTGNEDALLSAIAMLE